LHGVADSRSRLRGPARVLVVAELPVARLVALTLNHGAYVVRSADSVRSAESEIAEWQPHLLIADVEIDAGRGQDLLGRRRTTGGRLPTVALSRLGAIKSTLAAFERGADDVVAIPFVPEELVARVLALTRRSYGEGVTFTPVIRVGDIEIDLLEQQARIGRRTLRLTSIEQALLYLFASNASVTLSRDLILDTIWGSGHMADSNIVDRHVRDLRVKLGDDWRSPRYIATVPGKGYRFLAA